MEKQEKKGSWIKVFRNIENSWLWEEKPFSRGQAWIDLLLLAKFRDESFFNRRGNRVDGKRGHVYKSISSLADRWGWSRKKVDHFFDQLVADNMIKVNKKRASEETSIFIVNYSKYQIIGTGKRTSEEQVGNKSGTSEEQVEHIYKNNKNNKDYKNDKEIKKEPAAPLVEAEDDTEGIDLWGEDDDTVICSWEDWKKKNGDL